MSTKNEYMSVLQKLQEMAVLCRPAEPITFALRYLEDESGSLQAQIAHALQALPYLVRKPAEFMSLCCGVFCYLLSQDESNETIDKSALVNMLALLRTNENWLQNDAIEQIVGNIYDTNRVNFEVFRSIFRIYIIGYLLAKWVYGCIKSIVGNHAALGVVELNKVQLALRRSKLTASNCDCLTNPCNLGGVDDVTKWVQSLLFMLENISGSAVNAASVNVDDIVAIFVKNQLCSKTID